MLGFILDIGDLFPRKERPCNCPWERRDILTNHLTNKDKLTPLINGMKETYAIYI